MIQLANSIQINTAPSLFFDFMNNFDKQYIRISPNTHLTCRFLTPPPRGVGSITRSEEILFGKHQQARYKITALTDNELVMTALFPLSLLGGRLIFKLDHHNDCFILHEIIEMGFNAGFIGKFFDGVLNLYFRDKYAQLNEHSKEGLLNIKKILEKNDDSNS